MGDFHRCIELILEEEGGWSNHGLRIYVDMIVSVQTPFPQPPPARGGGQQPVVPQNSLPLVGEGWGGGCEQLHCQKRKAVQPGGA